MYKNTKVQGYTKDKDLSYLEVQVIPSRFKVRMDLI